MHRRCLDRPEMTLRVGLENIPPHCASVLGLSDDTTSVSNDHRDRLALEGYLRYRQVQCVALLPIRTG